MLIKNGAVAEDRWIAIDDDGELSGEWPVIVSLARWRKDRDLLQTRNTPVGLRLSSDDPLDEIVPDLDRFFLIALDFPAFTDGRPYSTSRLLRERLGLGHVLVGRLHGVRNDRATRGYRDPALDALSLRTRGLGKGEGHVLENWASNRRIFAGAG